MNPITEKIARLATQDKQALELEALIQTITKYGNLSDAQYLLPLFAQTKKCALLLPIQAHGDALLADKLFQQAVQGGKLKEGFPYETLIALSYLQHAPTEKVLIDYFKTLFDQKVPWDLHVAVCLGLLNYSCAGYEDIIKREIEKCLKEWLFPEMIPALAVKTRDRTMAEKLYHHGCTRASSDASAGLILGIALFGTEKKDLFKKILLNPDWEAASTSTGNIHYTIMGMSFLNITFGELFEEIKNIASTDAERMHQHLFLLADLLKYKIAQPAACAVRIIPRHTEAAAQVYHHLFELAEGMDVFEIISQYIPDQRLQEEIIKEFSMLQEMYRLQVQHEADIFVLLHQAQKGK